jgi:hypothetical protein
VTTGIEEQGDAGPRGPGTARRLGHREQAFWYGFAAVTYVIASIVQKGLSNWFVGPLWLVAVVWFGPLLVDRVRSAARTARQRNRPEEP